MQEVKALCPHCEKGLRNIFGTPQEPTMTMALLHRRRISLAVTPFSLIVITIMMAMIVQEVRSLPQKCGACQAVAAELEIGLVRERPRNHIDLRHRLDSKGQREGKVIDYKVSELRVLELLEDLCIKAKSYTLKTRGGKQMWVKIDFDSLLEGAERQEAEAYSKQMSTFCGRLIEETEEELEERIKNGSIGVGDVEKNLCRELSGYCEDEEDGDLQMGQGHGNDDEL